MRRSARDEETSIAIAMDAGANDYVQKPVRMPVLLARMTTQIARKKITISVGKNCSQRPLDRRICDGLKRVSASKAVKRNREFFGH